MAKTKRPTLISAVLLFGTVGLAGGTAALAANPVSGMMPGAHSDATQPAQPGDVSAQLMAQSEPQQRGAATPSPSSSTSPAAVPSATSSTYGVPGAGSGAAAAKMRAESAAPASPSPKTGGTVTYTVKRGDTLANIAAWFHQHGFGAIYAANRGVIGNDPNLIFPGQRITISGNTMTVSGQK